ncbi:MAG: alanine--tRNA ligase [Candidatus Omnitrophota bacterium]
MTADILRKKFLDFFKAKKHRVVESDSLVPKEDPTVLFTPAGMNQFKKQFLGEVGDFRRAATSQRCLRTDDLDKVGKTAGHHTFFEMLGNFSFGDYFKKDAIRWAWEFLIQELKISPEKLWVSVYKDDDEAYKIWKDAIGVPVNKIVKLGDKDNFWPAEAKEKGPNGPCGPCSEIFYDFGKDKGCGEPVCDPSCPCGRFVEIWNLVFTQFNRKDGGVLEPLPQKNIDTGMGLERLAAVMQGAPNNFETDIFQPIIKEIRQGQVKGQSSLGTTPSNELIYAVADHLRAVVFSIYDGILPSNEGRGYVVRKIIRKSVLALRQMGIEKPFLHKLVPVLAEIMKGPYPELSVRREDIAQVIQAEEKNFIAILDSSDRYLKEAFEGEKGLSNSRKTADSIFKLTDTYGLPLELIISWLEKKFGSVPLTAMKLYDENLQQQRQRSKSQSNMKGDVFASGGLKLDIAATKFSGYKNYEVSAKVLAIIKDGKQVKKAGKDEQVQIALDKTAFYAESGGQVSDTGVLVKGKNIFEVTDTQKSGKIIFHSGKVKAGAFKKADQVLAKVDIERRLSIARNHTATHLLQAALRQVLGPHVQQQGSLVEAGRLRFDFSHFKAVSDSELSRIEETVNSYILGSHGLSVKEMPLASAKKTGALAFFAEKYEGKVRVVSIGGFSREFCGGTHLDSTGQIGLFRIASEGSVASGIRRIEAVTGFAALQAVKQEKEEMAVELEKRLSRIKELEKQLNSQKINTVKSSVDELAQSAEKIGSLKLIAKNIPGADMAALRSAVDLIKQKTAGAVIALASTASDKALLVIGVTADLTQKGIDAAALVNKAAGFIGGSGGGRKDFAQAGGNNPAGIDAALAELKNIISQIKL